MKAVLISIQPKWCELIASGKKKVEIRKTKPKIQTPFKVYIYATKPRHYFKISEHLAATDENLFLSNGTVKMSDGFENWADGIEVGYLNGKVIGEFVCDYIMPFRPKALLGDSEIVKTSCVSLGDLIKYAPNKPFPKDHLYAWRISDLEIYDKPKVLSEFYQKCKSYDKDEWENDDCLECENPCGNGGKLYLKRPPQSWCYVEERW